MKSLHQKLFQDINELLKSQANPDQRPRLPLVRNRGQLESDKRGDRIEFLD